MTVSEAEQSLEHLNSELINSGYWKKLPHERAAAEKADPEIASRVAAANALREQLYDRLEILGEPNVQSLKREYGAIANVENEIRGQSNVQARQRPISLKQIIGIASGHPLAMAATLFDKIYNDPASLLNRAVEKTPTVPVE